MQYRDISHDTDSVYRLATGEKVLFFMLNRTGKITIELVGAGATAHVCALYTALDRPSQSLDLTQKHLAPDTVSSALVKAALSGSVAFAYDGAIVIDKAAHGSHASQEGRVLLLSSQARASLQPALEILAHDVICHHAATTSPVNSEALFFVRSRGLSKDTAEKLLVQGFFQEAFERMETLSIGAKEARERLISFNT